MVIMLSIQVIMEFGKYRNASCKGVLSKFEHEPSSKIDTTLKVLSLLTSGASIGSQRKSAHESCGPSVQIKIAEVRRFTAG